MSGVISAKDEESLREVSADGELHLKMDALGVIILASDGTMFRIRNWNEMIDSERRNTIRLIAKRNAKRKQELLLSKESGAAATEEGEGGGNVDETPATGDETSALLQIADVAAEGGKEDEG